MTSLPILRENTGIGGRLTDESSYEANLRQCLLAKQNAFFAGDLVGAGHAARGAAECLRRLGLLFQADREYATAHELFRTTDDIEGRAWTLYAQGNLQRQRSELAVANNSFRSAMSLAVTLRDQGLASYIIAGLAETSRVQGHYSQSYRQHLAAYKLFHSMDDSRGEVWALEGVGQMLRHSGRHDVAFRHFDKARRLATAVGDIRGLAYALKCRGECLLDLGHRHAALEDVSSAVELFTSMGLRVGLGYSLKALGDVHRRLRSVAAAFDTYDQAIGVFAGMDDARGFAYTLNAVGALCSELGDGQASAFLFAGTRHYFRSNGVRLGLENSVRGLESLARRRMVPQQHVREAVHYCTQAPPPSARAELLRGQSNHALSSLICVARVVSVEGLPSVRRAVQFRRDATADKATTSVLPPEAASRIPHISVAHDVRAAEDASRLVSAQFHRHALRNP